MSWLLNPKVWIGLALLAALAFTHGFVYRSGRAAVRNDWDAEKLVQAENLRLALKAAHAEKDRQQAVYDKAAHDAQSEIKRLADLRSRADVVSAGLQSATDSAVAAARRCSATLTSVAGELGTDPAGVLAFVLGRSRARGKAVDEYADALRVAGAACERSADGLSGTAAAR